MSGTKRRQLTFTSLEDAVTDARSLLQSEYHQAVNWNLAQILGHCNDWLCFPMDGYPKPPIIIRPLLWFAKVTFGKRLRKKIIESGRMKAGSPTMPETVKSPNFADDSRMVQQLADNARRFEQFTGRLNASPLFGTMTKEEHQQLQIIHLQHHLSFLIPKQSG